MTLKWNYKGIWPLTRGEQITAANFEDMRKILWALRVLIDEPEAEEGSDTIYDEFGELQTDVWSSGTDYAFGSTAPYYATVVYWDETIEDYRMYSNIRFVAAGGAPPPINSDWKLRPRENIYCDYARNADTYIFMYCGHAQGGGIYYYPAWLGLPPQFNKYTQWRPQIPDTQWTPLEVYEAGAIVKTTPVAKALRWWAKVRHKAVNTYTLGATWNIDTDYGIGDVAMWGDGDYPFVALRPIKKGSANPDFHHDWIRQGAINDPVIWQGMNGKVEDGERYSADMVYGLKQEKSIEFSITDRNGMSTLADPFAQMTGPIGTQYGRTDVAEVPNTYYYYKNGSAYKSDDSWYNANHYDFKRQGYQSFIESRAEQWDSLEVNPDYDRHGSGYESEPYLDNNHYSWDCNFSRFEKLLTDIDSYDWYLDISFPPSVEGKNWRPAACWRRMWKYSFGWPSSAVAYPSGSPYVGQPLIWPYELGSPPFHEWQTGDINGSTASSPLQSTPEDSPFPWMWWIDWTNVNLAYNTAVTLLHAMTDETRDAVWTRHAPSKDYYVQNTNLDRYPTGIERIVQYTLHYTMVQDMYDLLLAIHTAELVVPALKSKTHGGRKLLAYPPAAPLTLVADNPPCASIVASSSAGPPERIEDGGVIEPKPEPDMMDDSDWNTISAFEHWPLVGETGLMIHYAAPTYYYAQQTDSGTDIADDCYYIYGSGWNGYYRLGWTWSGLPERMKQLLLSEYFTEVWLTTYVRVFEGSIDVYEGRHSGTTTKHKNYSISTGAASVIAPDDTLSPSAPQETPAIWEAANTPYEWNEYQALTKWSIVERGLQYTDPADWNDREPIQYLIMLKATAERGSTDYRSPVVASDSLYLLGQYRMRVDLQGSGTGILFDLEPRQLALGCVPVETDWNN